MGRVLRIGMGATPPAGFTIPLGGSNGLSQVWLNPSTGKVWGQCLNPDGSTWDNCIPGNPDSPLPTPTIVGAIGIGGQFTVQRPGFAPVTLPAGTVLNFGGTQMQIDAHGNLVTPGSVGQNGMPAPPPPAPPTISVVTTGTGSTVPILDIAGSPAVAGGSIISYNGKQYQVSSSGHLVSPGALDSNGNVPYSSAPGGSSTASAGSSASAASSTSAAKTAPAISPGQTFHYMGYAITIQTVGSGGSGGLMTDEGVQLPIGTLYLDSVDGSTWQATGPNSATQVNSASGPAASTAGTTTNTTTPDTSLPSWAWMAAAGAGAILLFRRKG